MTDIVKRLRDRVPAHVAELSLYSEAADYIVALETQRDRMLDKEIGKIIADTSPVTEADRVSILEFNLGIAKGRNAMLAKALQSSLDIMRSYQRMGYGDEVYMSTLCQAVRQAERALALHVEEGGNV